MDKEEFIVEAKKRGLPDYTIHELLEIFDQAAVDGNPIPYGFYDDALNDNDFSFTYAKGYSPDTQA